MYVYIHCTEMSDAALVRAAKLSAVQVLMDSIYLEQNEIETDTKSILICSRHIYHKVICIN